MGTCLASVRPGRSGFKGYPSKECVCRRATASWSTPQLAVARLARHCEPLGAERVGAKRAAASWGCSRPLPRRYAEVGARLLVTARAHSPDRHSPGSPSAAPRPRYSSISERAFNIAGGSSCRLGFAI